MKLIIGIMMQISNQVAQIKLPALSFCHFSNVLGNIEVNQVLNYKYFENSTHMKILLHEAFVLQLLP